MKKQLLLLVLAMGLFSAVNAQSKLFGGLDLGFSSNDNESSFNLGPKLGYWLGSDMNMAIVVGLDFESATDKSADPELKATSFGVGAEFRYGWKAGDNVFIYLAPGVRFGSINVELQGGGEAKATELDLRIRPGITYNLSDRWSINSYFGGLGYHSYTPDGGDAFGTFGLDLSMSSLGFGLWYNF